MQSEFTLSHRIDLRFVVCIITGHRVSESFVYVSGASMGVSVSSAINCSRRPVLLPVFVDFVLFLDQSPELHTFAPARSTTI